MPRSVARMWNGIMEIRIPRWAPVIAIITHHTPQLHLGHLCSGQIVWSPVSCRNEKGTRMIKKGFSTSNFSDAVSFEKDHRILLYFHLCRNERVLKKFLLNSLLLGLSHGVGLSEHSRVLKIEDRKCLNKGEHACLLINVNVNFPSVLDTQRTVARELIFSLENV